MSNHILLLVMATLAILPCSSSTAQAPISSTRFIQKELLIFDLVAGRILGATIGMDEETTRVALDANGVIPIQKIIYPSYYLLQSQSCLGITFSFRGNHELNDIYTNSSEVTLSNGLKVGDSLKDFTEKLGPPSAPHRLPSGKVDELIYRVGSFDLCVIVEIIKPDVVRALSLRKHGP